MYILIHLNFNFQVKVYEHEGTLRCSCMVFEHQGMLCRHILCIMKTRFMKTIPEKYLLRRFKKDIIRAEELKRCYVIGDMSGNSDKLIQDAYAVISDCISIIAHDADAMKSFIKSQKEIRKKIVEKPPEKDTRSRAEKFARTLGVPTTLSNDIRNPENVKNKGRVSGKRMRSEREVAFSRSSKGSKTCSYCKKKVEPNEKHDRRTCPQKKEDEANKNNEKDMDGMFDSEDE